MIIQSLSKVCIHEKNHHFLFVLPDVSDDESIYEPEEVKRAWEELMIIQREQQR